MGVIMGSEELPMTNITFDGVVINVVLNILPLLHLIIIIIISLLLIIILIILTTIFITIATR